MKASERPGFDPHPVPMICPKCGRTKYVTRTDEAPVANCDCEGAPAMVRLVNALRFPERIVFAVMTEETIEERFFTYFEGMSVPRVGDEVMLPLEEGDALRETMEYRASGGVMLVEQLTLDYVHGQYRVLCYFLPDSNTLKP